MASHRAVQLLLQLGVLTVAVIAYPSNQDKVPNGQKVKDCDGVMIGGFGHVKQSGGGARNQFGLDFAEAGGKWTDELCRKDSDGDGVSNGVELGDPDCKWKIGETPQFTLAITHPGLNCATRSCTAGGVSTKSGEKKKSSCDKYDYTTVTDKPVVNVSMHMKSNEVRDGTSYMLQALSSTLDYDLAVTKFEWKVDHPEVVHHFLLYRCDSDMSHKFGTPTEKEEMGCLALLMAWAVGGSDFCMPSNISTIVKAGEFFVLEIHYDNPKHTRGIFDTSGMWLKGVKEEGSGLMPSGAAILGANLPNITVPARTPVHVAEVTITAERFNITPGVPWEVFAYTNHMHGIGRKQWATITKRGDAEERELACVTNYDFDLQEMLHTDEVFKLEAGMDMTLHCQWDSTERENQTLGGDASEDEMCILVLMYTPDLPTQKLAGPRVIKFHQNDSCKICGCAPGCSSGEVVDVDNKTSILLWHGVLMILAWVLLLPAGAAAAKFGKAVLGIPLWFQVHQGLQIVGGLVCLVAFGIAFSVTEKGSHFTSGHKGMGLFIVIFTVLQLVGGTFRPHGPANNEEPSSTRTQWLWFHRIVGGGLLLVCMLQSFMGIGMYRENFVVESQALYFVWFGSLVVTIAVIAYLIAGGSSKKVVDEEGTELGDNRD